MKLYGCHRPHLADAALYALLKSTSLAMSIHKNHDCAGVHDRADSDSDCLFGHKIKISAKEAGVGDDGILCELDATCARTQRRSDRKSVV